MKIDQMNLLNENRERWFNMAGDKIYNMAEEQAIVAAGNNSDIEVSSHDIKIAAETLLQKLHQVVLGQIAQNWGDDEF